MSSLIWLGRGKQKKVLDLCKTHLDKINEAVTEARNFVYAFCEGRDDYAKNCADIVFVKEREADDIKRRIVAELSRGVFHPIDRNDILDLLSTADDAASFAKAALGRLRFIPREEISENLRRALKKHSDSLVEMSELTGKSFEVLSSKPDDSLELADKVERLEEEIDDLRREIILPEVMVMFDKTDRHKYPILLKDVIESLENIADRYEDVIDVIRSIAVSHT